MAKRVNKTATAHNSKCTQEQHKRFAQIYIYIVQNLRPQTMATSNAKMFTHFSGKWPWRRGRGRAALGIRKSEHDCFSAEFPCLSAGCQSVAVSVAFYANTCCLLGTEVCSLLNCYMHWADNAHFSCFATEIIFIVDIHIIHTYKYIYT